MNILFDASVLESKATGIAKATLALYHDCLEILPSIQIAAFHRRPLALALPPGIRSICRLAQLPNRVWRGLVPQMVTTARQPTAVHFPWNGGIPRAFHGRLIVTTLHDVLPLSMPHHFASDKEEAEYRRKTQLDIDRTDLLLTDSEYSRSQILEHFRVRREPVVIYPRSLLPKVRCRNLADADYFIYVGGYDPRKGLEPMLRVFLELRRERKLTGKLLLTGQPFYYSEHLRELIATGCELGSVEELGYVSDTELVRLLCGAKALLYPSKYEGFGLPLLEAMALGCPVVAARATAIPETCGEAAFYIDPDDDVDFGRGLVRIQHELALRQELAARGKRRVREYSGRRSAQQYLQAIEDRQVARRRGVRLG